MADMVYRKKLIEYLPPIMQRFSEIKEIMNTEDIELENVNECIGKILDEAFIKDCSEYGIRRYESILAIVPDRSDSLEERKTRVTAKYNNSLPYTYRTLLKKLEVLYGTGNYEVSGDLQRYCIEVTVHSELRGQKRILFEILDGLLPINMVFNAKNEVLRHFIINVPEKMDICGLRIKTFIYFWNCDVLDGSKLLDGSRLLNAEKRYNLILGIKNIVRCYLNENIDIGRVYINILSCFVVNEKVCSANVVNVVLNFLDITGGTKLAAKIIHRAIAKTYETIGDVTITYRRNLHYLDGSELLDGSRLLNAFYKKEDI